jgi:hypothetical protein
MGIAAITTWSTNQVLTSAALNTNFSTIRDHYNANAVETSGAQTIAGVKTFSNIPVFSLGATIAAGGLTVTAGGATITAGGLTVAAGGATITGNSTVTGTLNVTSTLSQGGTAIPTGSGTNGKLTRWTGASTIGDAAIADDGTYTTNATQPRVMAVVAGESITTSAAISWDSAALNVGSMWSGVTPTRITIPASAGGSYMFALSGHYLHTANATITLNLRKGGTTTIGVGMQWLTYGNTLATNDHQPFSFTWFDDSSAADYYEVMVASSSGNINIDAQLTVRKVW